MMQFPFYGGMMTGSGFGAVVVGGIMNVASSATMPI
jgi:hypothetical protein